MVGKSKRKLSSDDLGGQRREAKRVARKLQGRLADFTKMPIDIVNEVWILAFTYDRPGIKFMGFRHHVSRYSNIWLLPIC